MATPVAGVEIRYQYFSFHLEACPTDPDSSACSYCTPARMPLPRSAKY
jgi:hypothetical protein